MPHRHVPLIKETDQPLGPPEQQIIFYWTLAELTDFYQRSAKEAGADREWDELPPGEQEQLENHFQDLVNRWSKYELSRDLTDAWRKVGLLPERPGPLPRPAATATPAAEDVEPDGGAQSTNP